MYEPFGILASLTAIFAIFLAVGILFLGIAFYVFSSYTVYKLAKKTGTQNAFLAWIPYANIYLIGEICGPMKLLGRWHIEKTGLVLIISSLAGGIVSALLGIFTFIPFLGIVFGIVASVFSVVYPIVFTAFYLCVLYHIFTVYVPKNTALIYTLVSIISVTIPFFLFSILKKEPISEGYDFTI